MCMFCDKAKSLSDYARFIRKMAKSDADRMSFTKEMARENSLLRNAIYTSMQWPVKFVEPMFEARAIYAVPNNYYQQLMLDGQKLGVSFSHGAMRSLFFVGKRLVVFSKLVSHREGVEYFNSLVLLHLEPGEYKARKEEDKLIISADVTKPMKNLVTGKAENKRVSFNFVNQSVINRIVSKEQVVQSDRFKRVYKRFGGARMKAASIDMEGYAITVPHFSPHPYLLQLHEQFGFGSNREMQEHTIDYFNTHLGI